MPFLGPIIQAVKGGVEKFSNESKIYELEREIGKDLFEDFSADERLVAQIKLKQVELELAEVQNRSRLYISSIEKELIALMEQNIKLKMEKLREKEATQLDIANTMIALQKTNNDLRDKISHIEKELNRKTNIQNSKIENLSSKMNRSQEQEEVHTLKTRIKEITQSIHDNQQILERLNNKQHHFKKDLYTQKNDLQYLQSQIIEMSQRIEDNETNIVDLVDTAQAQRWLNRIILGIALGGLIFGLINFF